MNDGGYQKRVLNVFNMVPSDEHDLRNALLVEYEDSRYKDGEFLYKLVDILLKEPNVLWKQQIINYLK